MTSHITFFIFFSLVKLKGFYLKVYKIESLLSNSSHYYNVLHKNLCSSTDPNIIKYI